MCSERINSCKTHLHERSRRTHESTSAVINERVCVTALPLCVGASLPPAASSTGPDVCNLWSGRTCCQEAVDVLNIISHRWSHYCTTRLRCRLLSPDHAAVFAVRVRVFVRLQTRSALTLLWLFQQDGPVRSAPGGLVPYGCGTRPGRRGGEWRGGQSCFTHAKL